MSFVVNILTRLRALLPRRRDPRHALGAAGEAAALAFLRQRGCADVDRNVHTPHGEIDLIVNDGGALVFVEVKVRATRGATPAKLQVDLGKQKRLRLAAQYELKRRRWRGSSRIDVIARDGDAPFEWLKGAVSF